MSRGYTKIKCVKKYNARFKEFITKKGLLQGGVLIPLSFIMIMDNVLKESNTSRKQTCGVPKPNYHSRMCIYRSLLSIISKRRGRFKTQHKCIEEGGVGSTRH